MKLSKLAVAAAIAWGIYVGNASAQTYGQQPVRQVSAGDYFYQPEASPSDRPPPAPMVEQAPVGNGVVAADAAAAPACDACAEAATCDPWRLFCQKECAWNFTGYAAGGYTWNPANPADGFNGPVTWMDRANEFQFTELWLDYFKATEYGTCDWQVGGRVTALYGSNYRWDTSAGLESKWNGGDFYGWALPNAYLEFTKGDVKTKVGHFVSPVGFYTVGTANNFFNLIPYTYQYGEPFTHTGVYSTWQANDDLELGAALINGWDSTANWDPTGTDLAAANPGIVDPWNRHLGGLVSAVKKNVFTCDGSDSFAYVGVFSNEPDITLALRTPRYLQTLVYQRQLSQSTQYILQSDYGNQERAIAGRSAQWYGINQYLYWKQNDCWKWGANVEWFHDDDGFRVGQVLPSFGSPNARGLARGPFQGDFYRIMAGPNWTPTANWTIRPTLVYDWYGGPGDALGRQPFDDGTRKDQFLLNVDAYFIF
jgi:hypothetical protein